MTASTYDRDTDDHARNYLLGYVLASLSADRLSELRGYLAREAEKEPEPYQLRVLELVDEHRRRRDAWGARA